MARLRLLTRGRALCAIAVVLITRFIIHTRLNSNASQKLFPLHNLRRVQGLAQKGQEEWLTDEEDGNYQQSSEETMLPPVIGECCDSVVAWEEEVEPKYRMDPEKFLIPTLHNGPNNQMMGFQQSILLALLLNRTLVLPTFFEHQSPDIYIRGQAAPEHRIDINQLRSFISVIPNSKAVKLCNSKFNAIFSSKGESRVMIILNKLVRIYLETGLSGLKFVEGVGSSEVNALKRHLFNNEEILDERMISQPWWPKSKIDRKWTWKIMDESNPIIPIYYSSDDKKSANVEDIKEIYKTDAKCALHWFPFRQFQFSRMYQGAPRESGKFNLQEVTTANGWNLYADILRHSMPPRSVDAWAKKFRNEVFGIEVKDYIGVHWRFDEEDFFGYLCKSEMGREKFCDEVRRATNVTAIAAGIIRRIDEVESQYQKTIEVVYFAAPPTLKTMVDSLRKELDHTDSFKRILRDLGVDSNRAKPSFYSIHDLESFIRRKYGGCSMAGSAQFQDTISQLEMNICQQSFSFMWSRQSTWSINVRLRRYLTLGLRHRRYDVSVMDYALKSIDK